MSKILLIDNYDSFTYNLFHYLEEFYQGEIVVMRNDEIEFARVDEYEGIVISPGPGLPKEAGQLMKFLESFAHKKRILGICLGQQAIAEHFEMPLLNLNEVVHGQSTLIEVLNDQSIFKSLPSKLNVGRYHSWVIDPQKVNAEFEVTAVDSSGLIMGIKHKSLPIEAVQFHPESVLTDYGKEMIKNWIDDAYNSNLMP